jgi:hypothetical protein
VRRFSHEVIKPRVREMDENSQMDPAVIRGAFENGVGSLIVRKNAVCILKIIYGS